MVDTDADSLESGSGEPATETAPGDGAPAPANGRSAGSAALEEECPKCGSMRPDSDEGICPTCGTPFGIRTQQMAVVTPDMLASRHGYASQGAMAVTDSRSQAAGAAATRARRTAVIVLLVAVAVALVLLAVVLSSR